MKIEGPSKAAAVGATRPVSAKRVEQPPIMRQEQDRVRLSAEARTLLEARGPETPDRAKIEALRDSIRAGTFTVDAERIADAMIAEEGT